MSLAPISAGGTDTDRQPSPRLTVNLGSNNPFRSRTSSPGLASPTLDARPERPLSTNPFLDNQESPEMGSPVKSPPANPELTGHAAELFENLSLDQPKDQSKDHPKPKPGGRRPPPHPRPENMPPNGPRDRKQGPPRPQPQRKHSKEDEAGSRSGQRPPREPLLDVFADPQSGPRPHASQRRPRRNSDSSVVDRQSKALDPEAEKRRRERRHRERESRHRDGKSRSKKPSGRRLDVIDKLDVTGIYGQGLFHHDGPFDACNPHRNRKGLRSAPMQAFPKDSRNMALGGSGPNKSNIDLNQFHGRGAEGYTDFATGSKGNAGGGGGSSALASRQDVSFDPSAKLEMIHGDESMGLGTSTFLEGAPASRTAIQRRQSENETQMEQNGGLQRKKSLAQKIRRMNTRGGGGSSAAAHQNSATSPDRDATAEGGLAKPSGGSPRRPSSSRRPVSRNPFFQQDYDDAYEKKGAKIQQAQAGSESKDDSTPATLGRSRSTSTPNPGLERRVTTGDIDAAAADADDPKPSSGGGGIGGGLMSRVKSLRRPRTERRPSAKTETKNDSDYV